MNQRIRTKLAAAVVTTLALGALACSKNESSLAKATSIVADDKGFTPSSVEVKMGTATTLTFMRTSDETCAKEVVFPELNVKKELPLNKPVAVDVPAGEARTLTFQCGMGMYKGKVVVQ